MNTDRLLSSAPDGAAPNKPSTRDWAIISICGLLFAGACSAPLESIQDLCTRDSQCAAGRCLEGRCVQCTVDSDCNRKNKCRVCSINLCVQLSDCCTDDSQCIRGQHCIDVRGRSYGQCRDPL